MDFLSVTDERQGFEIFGQWIARPRLGLHLRLAELSKEIDNAMGGTDNPVSLIAEYFELIKFDSSGLNGVEQLNCFTLFLELNKLKMIFAFQLEPGAPEKKPAPYEYDGRNWVWWIHKIASRYNWTSDYILGLWPEEAAAYLQEIILSEYDESDEARSLSDIAYKYDPGTKKSYFRPLPRPSWMKENRSDKKRTIRVRRDMLPMGDVINLTDMRADDTELL